MYKLPIYPVDPSQPVFCVTVRRPEYSHIVPWCFVQVDHGQRKVVIVDWVHQDFVSAPVPIAATLFIDPTPDLSQPPPYLAIVLALAECGHWPR